VGQFRNAQAAGVKQFDDRAITQSERHFCVDAFEQLLDLQFVQRFGQITFNPRQREHVSRILIELAFTGEKSKENFEGDDD
jgi:hypothetical protein